MGRRGGKSRIAALVAVYLACFRSYRTLLAPGERGTLMVIAADRRQARVVYACDPQTTRATAAMSREAMFLRGLIG